MSPLSHADHAPPPPEPRPGASRRAAAAAWAGGALEYYDFFLYGSASALVFPHVFFSPDDPATATLVSLASFGVAYAARPVGAFLLGHAGDRLGRRTILLFTLSLMGLSTLLIGCLPTYGQVGTAAPVLLVALRVLQGLSAAGEQAGAGSMTLEHAPEGRRGYFTSFTLGGTQAGQVIATLVFVPVTALPDHDLYSWGWRVPFWLSLALTTAGYLVRRRVEETPVFTEATRSDTVAARPLVVLLRDHWAAVLRVVAGSLVATVSTVFTVWSLSFATGPTGGLGRSLMLWVGVAANLVALGAIPLWARLSDRVGRRPVFLVGAVGSGVTVFLYLWAITTGDALAVLVAGVLFFGVVYSAANGVWPSFYGEMFPARVRLSGMAIGTQVGFAVAGFAVSFAERIAGPDGAGWLGVAVFTAAICGVAALAAVTARETHRTPTAHLGLPTGGGPAPREAAPAAGA